MKIAELESQLAETATKVTDENVYCYFLLYFLEILIFLAVMV